MTNLKPWCWQPAENGNGPDWLLLAKVAPTSVEALAQVFASATLDGYTRCADASLIDTANAATYADNLAGKASRNIWVYNFIQVQYDTVMFESGYGGRGNPYPELETAFFLRLFDTQGIVLRSWEVLAGGNGYSHTLIHAGTDLDSVIAYVTPY